MWAFYIYAWPDLYVFIWRGLGILLHRFGIALPAQFAITSVIIVWLSIYALARVMMPNPSLQPTPSGIPLGAVELER